MMAVGEDGGLVAWAGQSGRRRCGGPSRGLPRSAFCGRVSAGDWQDPVTSRARQLAQAAALAAGPGVIVAEFSGIGQSRAAWARRRQAAALLAALAGPGRGRNAIVTGEYERAFYGSQHALMAPLSGHYRVQLRMPEAGGRAGSACEHDERAMTVLGLSSTREITRASIGVRTAMAAQTREQGRRLGGRPPHGRRLAGAGPHPDKAHTAWGGRAWRREPGPETGHVAQRVLAQRLAGHPAARTARALDEAGLPRPSAAGPAPSPHRTGAARTPGTAATILADPRHTGRQVQNRQRTDRQRAGPASTSLGHKMAQRRNLPGGRVTSARPAHPPLASEADFIAAQGIDAARGPAPGTAAGAPVRRRHLLAGLLARGVRGRPMEPARPSGKAACRRRHRHTSAASPDPGRPPNARIRQDRILAHPPALHLVSRSARPDWPPDLFR